METCQGTYNVETDILTAPIAAPRHERPHRLWMHAIDAQTEIEASMPGTMIPGASWRQIELRAAMASFEKEKWVEAMNREYRELTDKGTFEPVYFPAGEQPHICANKWVLTKKYDADGNLERHKARCVVKGFSQVKGENYDETYAPVASIMPMRLAIALAVIERMLLFKLDISNAFSQADMNHDLYVSAIEGFPIRHKPGFTACLRVLKSWYGCKQGPRNWYQLLYSIFTAFSTKNACWKVSDSDKCCLVFIVNGQIVMRAVTIVDDILFTVKQEHESQYHRFVAFMKTPSPQTRRC